MSAMQFIRKEILGITQAAMATLVNTSQATVSRWEKGELEPSRDQLALIRQEAIRRNLKWDDAIFFSEIEVPFKRGDRAA